MGWTKSILKVSIPACLLFGLWGYAYEVSYFRAMGLDVHNVLTLRHYIVSGAMVVVPMFLASVLFVQLAKFFGKDIYRDDARALLDQLKKTTFKREVVAARIGLTVSIGYWVIVVFVAPRYGFDSFSLAAIFWWMSYCNLAIFFLGAIMLSPPYARLSVGIAFVVAVGLCFSAGGYGFGTQDRTRDGTVRDDYVVRVLRTSSGTVTADAKPLRIPIPFIETLIEKLSMRA